VSTTGKTLLVAALLIALGVVCVRFMQTTCAQENPSLASCTQEVEFEDCDAEDRKNYEKECGIKSPAARRTKAPSPAPRTTKPRR
jgi:hypothetical protein